MKLSNHQDLNHETVGSEIIALHKDVIVQDMDFGERVVNGIVLLSDDKKDDGIRPRWAKVYAVGPKQKDVSIGQWVLVGHGRWTRGVKFTNTSTGEEVTIRKVDPKDMLMTWDGEGNPPAITVNAPAK
jgi:hypothetical protein